MSDTRQKQWLEQFRYRNVFLLFIFHYLVYFKEVTHILCVVSACI